jgi:hypothetical protein
VSASTGHIDRPHQAVVEIASVDGRYTVRDSKGTPLINGGGSIVAKALFGDD